MTLSADSPEARFTLIDPDTGRVIAAHLTRDMATELDNIEYDRTGRPCRFELEVPEPIVEPTLLCLSCGNDLPLNQFTAHRGTKRGYNTFCRKCNTEYHAAKGFKLTSNTRTFGVEIECYLNHSRQWLAARLQRAGIACYDAGYSHTTVSQWKLVSDGSLSSYGIELVSPPLSGSAGLAELRKVCSVLKRVGATVNRSCGVHIHHDATDLELAALKELVKLYVKHEADLDEYQPTSRRGDNAVYCRSMRRGVAYHSFNMDALWERIDNAYSVQDLRYLFGDRYAKVNLDAIRGHGTVEMRHHAGTINYDKIAAWVCLTQGMVEAVAKGQRVSKRAKAGHDKLFTAVKATPKVRAFYRKRRAALNTDPDSTQS